MEFRWIVYLEHPMGGFELDRATSLDHAGRQLVAYCEATGYYADLQVNGNYGCTASLHPYTEEDWAEAEEYGDIGCPFDYPSKLVRRGPRGGTVIENA